MESFRDIYLAILTHASGRQSDAGSMPAGHNGHYHDPETPVRNTSHYLIAFLRAWELSGDEAFKTAAVRCLDWLLKDNPHRQAHTFHHRTKAGKDRCSGLIGPAWNMEALLYASSRLERPEARALARELFLMHPFDGNVSAWKRVEPDGAVLPYDATFNHQLWFAAAASPLSQDTPEVAARIDCFLNGLKGNWALAGNGRIIHPLWVPQCRLKERAKRALKPAYRREMVEKEVGYQTFNLQAFALMKQAGLVWPDFIRTRVTRALRYLNHAEFVSGIDGARFGYPYNPPGWEASVAQCVLGGAAPEACRTWMEKQLAHSYDRHARMLSRNTADAETHTARIYEVALLPNPVFDIIPSYDSDNGN